MANATENLFTLYHFATISWQNDLILKPVSSREQQVDTRKTVSKLHFNISGYVSR